MYQIIYWISVYLNYLLLKWQQKDPESKTNLIISSTLLIKVLEEKEVAKLAKEKIRSIREQKNIGKQNKSEDFKFQPKIRNSLWIQVKEKRKRKFDDSSNTSIDVEYADTDNDNLQWKRKRWTTEFLRRVYGMLNALE